MCEICGEEVQNGHDLRNHFNCGHVTNFDSNCKKCAKTF